MSETQNQKQVKMDKKVADATLQQVFVACNQAPNTTDVDSLVENNNEANKTGYTSCIRACVVILVIIFFLPLAFAPFRGNLNAVGSSVSSSAPISVEHHEIRDGNFLLTVSGDLVDFSSAYAVNSDGAIIYPTSYSVDTGIITFPYDESEWNIYVSDYNGEQLHLLLSPR